MPRDLASAILNRANIGQIRRGVVKALPGGGFVTVNLHGGEDVTVRHQTSYVPAVNDVVVLVTDRAGWIVTGRLGALSASPDISVGMPQELGTSISPLMVPTFTGTFQEGRWRTDTRDLYAGANPAESIGCAFYGRQPSAWDGVIGASSGFAVLRIMRLPGVGIQFPTVEICLLAGLGPTANDPVVVDANNFALDVDEWAAPMGYYEVRNRLLPTDWNDALRNGSAGGIGFRRLPINLNQGRQRIAGGTNSSMTLVVT
jgi:hypothetical protein